MEDDLWTRYCALAADRNRLRKALEVIAGSDRWHIDRPVLPVIAEELQQIARSALECKDAPGARQVG